MVAQVYYLRRLGRKTMSSRPFQTTEDHLKTKQRNKKDEAVLRKCLLHRPENLHQIPSIYAKARHSSNVHLHAALEGTEGMGQADHGSSLGEPSPETKVESNRGQHLTLCYIQAFWLQASLGASKSLKKILLQSKARLTRTISILWKFTKKAYKK